jgi:error-prone DNA polymerase
MPPPAPPYVPLRVRSNFSFLEGASHPEELVEAAHRLGLDALALTDRDGLYGVVRAHQKATELGVRLLVGAELTLRAPLAGASLDEAPLGCARPEGARPEGARPEPRLTVLARSRAGYGALCRMITRARQRADKGDAWSTLDEVCAAATEPVCGAPARGELLVLCGEPEALGPLAEAFGRDTVLAAIARHRLDTEPEQERALRRAAASARVATVAACEVLYHTAARRPLQDVLTCIRHGTSLRAAGTLLRPNDEYALAGDAAMRQRFADDLDSLARTREVAEACRFSMAELRYVYPGERVPEGHTAQSWLRELTFRGARERYLGEPPDAVRAQLERELAVIADLDYGGYFLTMWEIVQFCRSRAILCQGRGSAANSAVCYCLGITAIDPVRMDLLFERFLSRERAEPPDIDLDIEHGRREEVIQWVYARHGRRHAAMVANVIRYRSKSAVRDVGKALGLPATEMDHLSKLLGYRDGLTPETLRTAGFDPEAPTHRMLLSLSAELQDFPRHLSIHPGGFLLGHEPVDTLVPVEPAAMEGRTVIQWDKYDVEALGLFKVDLLALGSLTLVRRAFELLRAHHGADLDMARVPAEDPDTYAMCARGDTVGVFQIESRAQMSMLPRLRPRTFYDLVIEVAIVRPGPIQGDMVHPYLRRREGEEPVVFPHPALERALAKTLGVPIFQEQVMKLAVLVAGYTPGEADQLRRDMAAWKSAGRIEQHRERIVGRMVRNGIAEEFAERVFAQIRGFGEYGFPESHAASFALIAYVTAWLKRHYPAAFACALLDAQPMGFYAPSTIVEDARRHGVEVRPICVNRSEVDCTLEHDGRPPGAPALRMGLRWVRGLAARERDRLVEARADRPFESLDALARRTRLSGRALLSLAEAGALAALGVGRRDALWRIRGLHARRGDALPLGEESAARFDPLGAHEEVVWDYRASSHSVRGHPMARFRPQLRARGVPSAADVLRLRDGARCDYVGYVICRQRPGTASGVVFYTMEDETGFVNVVCWAQVFEAHEAVAKTASLLGVRGRIQSQHGVVNLVAEALYAPVLREPGPTVPGREAGEAAAERAGPRDAPPRSRDFH